MIVYKKKCCTPENVIKSNGISLWLDAWSRFAGTLKCICDILKDYRKAFDEKRNNNRSQINDENNIASEVEKTFSSKKKGKKHVLDGVIL